MVMFCHIFSFLEQLLIFILKSKTHITSGGKKHNSLYFMENKTLFPGLSVDFQSNKFNYLD